ncbi:MULTISPECIES: PAC2 family protein [unclassified Arthrobacter]|uniref:PAC2 family protein n=1 Tax=unclassified Arthrobacter TaxID=235627 RepID=UPI0006FD79CF|nr:PAC2 family protein [Arthrobacter sp. Leaf234]KQO00835.1 carboxylate--amine ligase [Arthrobacter sp. Leaf234]
MDSFDEHQPTGVQDLFQDAGEPERRITIMLAAFEGWNDAGEAASDALTYMGRFFGSERISTIDADEFYDFQFTRPVIKRNSAGQRRIKWPNTRISKAVVPDSAVDLILVNGVEPSYKWRAYTAELVALAKELNVDCIVLVGALLADVPHSRPIPVTVTSDDDLVRESLEVEPSTYEGPIGIVGVLAEMGLLADIPTMSLWAAVPHYVGQSPSPKAQLALLNKLEEILQISVETHVLTEESEAWERGVDELATEDPEVAAYVRQLEEAKDTVDLPEASGESIAREFERYLKKRRREQ